MDDMKPIPGGRSRRTLPNRVLTLALACALVPLAGCQTGPGVTVQSPAPPAKTGVATPAEALRRLQEGNARYVSGRSQAHDWASQRRATAGGQHPFAAVLGCIDSRVPGEVVFDQGLGDIFHARLAGNVVDDDVLGSLEFAAEVAGARLVAVVGHTRCGAVRGASTGAQLGHLTGLLARIQPAVAEARAAMPGVPADDPRFVEEVARRNVLRVQREIRERSPILARRIDAGKLGLVGAIYDIESGKVEFLNP